MLVVFLGAQLVKRSIHTETISLYELPLELGNNWLGREVGANVEWLKQELGAQSIIFREYTRDETTVLLYLAYYKNVDSANKVHAPTVCYPGQGWTVKADETIDLNVSNEKEEINRLIVEKGKKRDLVYNWWQTGDKVLSRNSSNRFYQMFRSITGKNGSSVWVRISIGTGKDTEAQDKMLAGFARELMPLIKHYFD